MAAYERLMRRVLFLIVIVSLLLGTTVVFAQSGTTASDGYYYTVQYGDTWGNLSWRTGVPTAALQAANPSAVHPYGWLWTGEVLYIPGSAQSTTNDTTDSSSTSSAGGYWYQVKAGESWRTVSRDSGVSMLDLWHANPTHIHPNYWLWTGEWLWIPGDADEVEEVVATQVPTTQTPTTQEPTAVPDQDATPVQDAEAVDATSTPIIVVVTATPDPARATATPYVLVVTATPTLEPATATSEPSATVAPTVTPVPTATETAVPTETTAPTATEPPTATAVPTATFTPTPKVLVILPATVAPSATVAPTATSGPSETTPATSTSIPTATPTARATSTPRSTATSANNIQSQVTPVIRSACPSSIDGYADAIKQALGDTGVTVDDVRVWLTSCDVVDAESGGVEAAALSSAQPNDVIVALNEAKEGSPDKVGLLLVYHSGTAGYTLARSAEGVGSVALLQAGDINQDGMPDIAWTDTTCGAHTCFSTLFVDSWDGKTYRDWVDGEPTMAYGEYSFKDVTAAGEGDEIMAHGGVIGSVGAGPQRAWTETYISENGEPYTLYSQVFDASTCLYHKILDGDQAMDSWAADGFAPAIAVYKRAIDDDTLEACGTMTDELNTLRDFARFRLMVAYVASGKSSLAEPLLAEIQNSDVHGVAERFMESYRSYRSIVQACRDVTAYATNHPDSWQFMSDWGYANPTFEVGDLCPLG